jgi:hypothetical protein
MIAIKAKIVFPIRNTGCTYLRFMFMLSINVTALFAHAFEINNCLPTPLKVISYQVLSDTTSKDSIMDRGSSIYKCFCQAIDNPELTLDYIEKSDSSLTFYLTHSLSGDSLLFQSYSLRAIVCINQNQSDTLRDYQSNMMLKQDKRIYAGAPCFYYLRFPLLASELDTIQITQAYDEGPINFPPIVLNELSLADSANTSPYLSEVTTGTVAFYTRQRLGTLDVSIDDNYVGTIHKRIKDEDPTPECGDIGETLVNTRIASGKHTYTIRNGKYRWDGEFYMLRESCVKINIGK